eukprot:symbB.v1.2.013735.t1/scaffold977.1/size148281/18
MKSLKESQVELPQLQLQLAEAERKRQTLLEEMKAQENDLASCKSAFQIARSIRADEVKTYEKDLASLTSNQKRLQDLLATQDGASLAEVSRTGEKSNGTSLADTSALQRLSLSSTSSTEVMELLQDPAATAGQKIQVMEMLRNMLDGVNKDLAELKAAETKRKTVFEAMECLGGFASSLLAQFLLKLSPPFSSQHGRSTHQHHRGRRHQAREERHACHVEGWSHHGRDEQGAGEDCRRGWCLRSDGLGTNPRRYPPIQGCGTNVRPQDDQGNRGVRIHSSHGKMPYWTLR